MAFVPLNGESGVLMTWTAGGRSERDPSRREGRVAERRRDPRWRKPPRRIEPAECIGCDTCLRHCPEEFGAIVNHGLDVVILPELCSGCPKCVAVCPVDCIYVDEDWIPSPEPVWDLVHGTDLALARGGAGVRP